MGLHNCQGMAKFVTSIWYSNGAYLWLPMLSRTKISMIGSTVLCDLPEKQPGTMVQLKIGSNINKLNLGGGYQHQGLLLRLEIMPVGST